MQEPIAKGHLPMDRDPATLDHVLRQLDAVPEAREHLAGLPPEDRPLQDYQRATFPLAEPGRVLELIPDRDFGVVHWSIGPARD